MTDTQHYEKLKVLLNEKQKKINHLGAYAQKLQQEFNKLKDENKRLSTEARLAVDDAELARSFSQRNYQGLVKELFEQPLKRFHWIAYFILLPAIAISIGTSLFTFFYINGQSKQQLQEVIDQLSALPSLMEAATAVDTVAQDFMQSTPSNSLPTTKATSSTNLATLTREPGLDAVEMPTSTTDIAAQQEAALIEKQSSAILAHINKSEAEGQVQPGYRENINKLVQLYLITMQHASKEPILYESFLAAFDALNINASIKPSSIEELVAIDKDFLHANFNAYTITQLKQKNGWRYRDSDRRFSSYYGGNHRYSLEAWQIINDTQDYQILPSIFAINIKKIVDRLAFNQQFEPLNISNTLFYKAYSEVKKNEAVGRLLNNAPFTSQKNVLTLNISQLPLALTQRSILRVQNALAGAGFMDNTMVNGVTDKKTAEAISAYRKANSLPSATHIDINLLNTLDIQLAYKDILFDIVRPQ